MSLLIYGSYGYTGELIVKEALKQGLRPVLAGRDAVKIQTQAEKYGLDFLVFSLENALEISQIIAPFTLVLHCAGPFRDTAQPMVEACLKAGVHYADITGEIAILEWAQQKNEEAIRKGITILCGAGFDLVPTDCVAATLKQKLPDANHLEIAFSLEGGGISHGTLTTMNQNLGQPGTVRTDGLLQPEPLGLHGREFIFGTVNRFCMSVPWGDLSAAYFSTGIPNIRTFVAAKKSTYYLLKIQFLLNPILKSKGFKKIFQWFINRKAAGPSEMQNRTGKTLIHGRVWNHQGESASMNIQCAESYAFTAKAAAHIAQKILSQPAKPGYHTPSTFAGPGLVFEMEGTKLST